MNTTQTSSIMGTTKSIAILIGNSGAGGKKNSISATTVPLVVWTLQERGLASGGENGNNDSSNNTNNASPPSPWKYNLQYYEFLDDTARWTHLDQLLLQLCDTTTNNGNSDDDEAASLLPSIHLGTSENLEKIMKKSKQGGGNSTQSMDDDTVSQVSQSTSAATAAELLARTKKLVESLQSFLENRLFQNSESNNCSVHLSVPVDPHKVQNSLAQLLLNTEEAQLAVRGNVKLSEPLIRQGLALWLQSEGLYHSGGGASSIAVERMEASVKVFAGLLTSHLVMDSTAAQAIHLLPPPNDGVATVVGGTVHNNSLYGLLSKPCLTQSGKKLLQVWLRQPLVNLEQIQQRQDAVTQLLGTAKDSIRDGLSCFSGNGAGSLAKLGPALAKYHMLDEESGDSGPRVANTNQALESLYHLYNLSSRHLPHLIDCMECLDGDEEQAGSPILSELYRQVKDLAAQLGGSVGLAEAVLDLDQAPEEFLVRPDHTEGLSDFHNELEDLQAAVKEEHEAIQAAWDDIQPNKGRSSAVRLERIDDNSAWQFRLPDTNDSKMVESLGNKIKIHRILKNGVYFTSLELRQHSTAYQDLRVAYDKETRKIVQQAMGIASTYANTVERASVVISTLDVFCSLAYTAAMSPNGYCRPTMTDSDEDGAGVILKEARHPCVELQDGLEFIPNDVSLIFPNPQLLVSGPNMGGKSVYIRSVGAIVCMAQIGSYVPATSATINICHSILARVGAGDLQERGISTFMAEMLESSAILRSATKRSLIIIDELGRGTSTFDGYGLARSITEYLRDRVGCMVIFATHFHELTTLEGVNNCHVTAQKGSQGLTFLYQLRPGPCLESFGIQVAEMAHMPKIVIEDAKKRARELEHFSTASENDTSISKRSKLSKEKTALMRFAQLDFPSMSDDERKTKLQEILMA